MAVCERFVNITAYCCNKGASESKSRRIAAILAAPPDEPNDVRVSKRCHDYHLGEKLSYSPLGHLGRPHALNSHFISGGARQ